MGGEEEQVDVRKNKMNVFPGDPRCQTSIFVSNADGVDAKGYRTEHIEYSRK